LVIINTLVFHVVGNPPHFHSTFEFLAVCAFHALSYLCLKVCDFLIKTESFQKDLLGAYELSTMSTIPVEVAEEALEKKVEAMKIVDGNNMEVKKETTDGKNERRERKVSEARNAVCDRSIVYVVLFARMTDEERRRVWEEEQKTKKVVETGLKGHVKWYSVLGHYGFISRADGKPDIFVHQSAIAKSQTEKFYLRTLADEEEVEFDIVEGRKGPEASNVTGPNGGNVKGSKYQRVLLYRFRPNRRHVSREEDGEKKVDGENQANGQSGDMKKPTRGRRNGRRFRGRRIRQQQTSEHKEDAHVQNEGEEPAKTEETGTNLGKPGFRRRGNYYNRRFRTQNKNAPKREENGETVNTTNGSSATASPGAGVHDEDPKPGMRRRAESNASAKDAQMTCDANNLGGGDTNAAINSAV
ncbi:cold-shock DNA-binding domain protein, partial [Ancylostoma caninum]